MKQTILILVCCTALWACKNNGQKTAQTEAPKPVPTAKVVEKVKDIIVANHEAGKPDFRVLEMTNENDVLTVVVQYGGGCEEHDFNAYFSGGWAKSLPPQAAISLEHLNPNNDRCRSIVRDTFHFNMQPLQYGGAKEVVVKWNINPKMETLYRY